MKHTNPLFKEQPLDVNMDGQITINIKRAEEDLKEYGTVEQQPKMEGRQMVMLLVPASGKGKQ